MCPMYHAVIEMVVTIFIHVPLKRNLPVKKISNVCPRVNAIKSTQFYKNFIQYGIRSLAFKKNESSVRR